MEVPDKVKETISYPDTNHSKMASKDETNYDALEVEATKPVHALFSAVSSSKLRLVRLLIDGGLNVDTRSIQYQTPLLAACSSLEKSHFRGETRERLVKYLIEAGANVNAQDKVGRTPLIYAVITQTQASVVFYLVEAGADLWLQDYSQNCAFDYAVQREDIGQVGVMVEAYKRRNSCLGKEAKRSHEKAAATPTDKFTPSSARKYNHKVEISRNQGTQKKHCSKAIDRSMSPEGTGVDHSKRTSNFRSRPACPVMSPQDSEEKQLHSLSKSVHGRSCKEAGTPSKKSSDLATRFVVSSQLSEENQFCTLCKNVIFAADREPKASANLLDLNLSEYDLSGLLYRRRSTGSLFGLTQQLCESIQWKKSLGITLEDLFSTTEINCPNFEGQSLFVKSRRTNTMVDISTSRLSVLDLNRARSVSVSLPPADNPSQELRFLGKQAFASLNSEQRMLLGHELLPRPCNVPVRHASLSAIGLKLKEGMVYTSESRSFGANDSDEDWDEIQVKPSSLVDVTSPPADDGSSSSHAGGETSESGRSSTSCSPPIPRIVLTDFVQTSRKEVQ